MRNSEVIPYPLSSLDIPLDELHLVPVYNATNYYNGEKLRWGKFTWGKINMAQGGGGGKRGRRARNGAGGGVKGY